MSRSSCSPRLDDLKPLGGGAGLSECPLDGMLPAVEPDEWMRRLSTLPLMYQPGERWLYNVSDDLLARAMQDF